VQGQSPKAKIPAARKDTGSDNSEKAHIETKVFESFDELSPMQQEWDSFVESTGGEIFLTYDWCRIWWKYYECKRKLRVFTFRHKGTLVGIIPIFLEKIWLGPTFVRAIKIVGTDFTPIAVSLPIRDDFLYEVLQAFLGELVSLHHWDILCIGPLAGLSDKCEKIVSACRETLGDGYKIQEGKGGDQTYFKLAGSWEEQVSKLPKQERYLIRRSYKAIHSEAEKLTSIFASRENFAELFDNFVQMHQTRWHKAGKGGHFQDWPNGYNFHHEVAAAQLRHNRLRLLEVKLGSTHVGYKYGYKFGDKYYSFLDARSVSQAIAHLDLGRILFGEQVKRALEENIKYIDSMRGKYEHKLHLGGELLPIHNIYIFRSKLSTIVRIHICRGLCWLFNVCYHKIWFRRIAPKLPFRRGPLWKMWIKSQILLS